MKTLRIILLFFMSITLLNAQNQRVNQQRTLETARIQAIGNVSGKVIDAQTNQPIEYANVVLYRWKDSTVANGTVTNSEGQFNIEKLMTGRYFMKISYIGYATKRFDSIIVTQNQYSYVYNNIKLNPKNVNMNEVIVSSEREQMNYNIDKKVYNVDKNLANSGGTAIDVVQNLPAVQVDADGSVSVRGNSNITVLVDGRPAEMAGFSGSDVLAQIPASQIESIELVTNPSAKYDPQGTAGIINVVLKKKSNLGVNGSIMANAGTKGRYSTSVNGNLRGENFNLFGSYDGRFFNFNSSGSTIRNSDFSGVTSLLDQYSTNTNKMKNNSLNIGGDYYFTEKEFVTLSTQQRFGDFDSYNNNINKNFNSQNILDNHFERVSNSDRSNNSGNYTLSYKKTFENKAQELTADLMYSQSSMTNLSNIQQNYFVNLQSKTLAPSIQKNNSDNTNKMLNFEVNYNQPLNSWGKVEVGLRSLIRDLKMFNDYYTLNNSLNNWLVNSLNHYDYKEQLYALYGIYNNAIGKFSFQFGLRAEQAIIDGEVLTTSSKFTSKYFEVYPTVHFRYSVSDFDEITLSYSRRIDRPRNNQLNPYEDRSDSLNIIKGNPNLKPQFFNSIEAGYSTLFNKTGLVTNVYYRTSSNLISTISTLQPNGISYSTYQNVSKGSSYGVDFIVTQPIQDWWRLSGTISYYTNKVEDKGTLGGTRESSSWRTMINSQMTLGQGFTLQSMVFYNSPSIMLMLGGFGGFGGFGGGGGGMRGGGGMGGGDFGGFFGASTQTKIKEIYWMDLMLRKDFMDGQLSVTLRASDIFNTRKFNTITTASNFTSVNNRIMDSRMINLGITYRLDTRSRMMEQERQKRIEEGYDEL
ncbi:MAG: TonB-dependent receptor family protein [Melioribacteraceae bacterium]|nr:TonB-dependent receptor family protein [Melioribacteraceae bacterium]